MFSKYRYVYEVYKEKNFTRAAEKLFISQPSLSAAVKNIEEKLGAEIFERRGTGVKLTEIGREYISSAEQIMKIEQNFEDRISDICNLETGHITVGGSNYMSSYVLPKIINRFTSLHPNIEVTLKEANSEILSGMVKNEEVDIIIDSFDEDMNEYVGYPIHNERILLCVPKDRKINERLKRFRITPDSIHKRQINPENVPPVSINEFKDEKFVLLKKGSDMYRRATDIFEKNNINPTVVFSVDQLNISYALADSGIGLCFVSDTFFRYAGYGQNVVLYNVEEEHSSRMLYLAHKKNKYSTKAMKEFIRVAHEVIG